MAVGRDDAHDGVHILLKAHIEHPISLVEHCVAHLMREPIGRHQRPSVLMRVPSGLISAHECSSAYVVQSRDACLEKVEQSARRGEEHMHLWGEGGDGAVVSTCMLGERGVEHMHRSSAVMGGHGRS